MARKPAVQFLTRGSLQFQRLGNLTRNTSKTPMMNTEKDGMFIISHKNTVQKLADLPEPFEIPAFLAITELLKIRKIRPRTLENLLLQLYQDSQAHPYLTTFAHKYGTRANVGAPEEGLHPGELLLRARNHIPGITSAYFYISAGITATTAHCEDFHLPSINIDWVGASKMWLVVRPSSLPIFERSVRTYFGCNRPCSQFVRHLNCLPSPSLLKAWGVDFEVVEQKAGQLVVLDPYVYHVVINSGPSLAEAINFAFPSWSPHLTYTECTQRCHSGQSPITRDDFVLEDKPRPLTIDESNEDPTPLAPLKKGKGSQPPLRRSKRNGVGFGLQCMGKS